MPSKTETTWTCSRCGATEAGDGDNWRPIKWRVLRSFLLEPGASHNGGWDLCDSCCGHLNRFLHGARLFPAEGITVAPSAVDRAVEKVRVAIAERHRLEDAYGTVLALMGPNEQAEVIAARERAQDANVALWAEIGRATEPETSPA